MLFRLSFLAFISCFTVFSSAVGAESNGEEIAGRFQKLTRDTRFELQRIIPLNFDTYHPQGMTLIGDRIFLSSVQVINRAKGVGIGHLFVVDFEGTLIKSIALGDGAAYHPGGIDFDGNYLWVSVAEYRPNSNSIVYRIDPETLEAEEIFRFNDHLGAILYNRKDDTLMGVNWGSRRYYRWQLNSVGMPENPKQPTSFRNVNHMIDFQDGQWLWGTSMAIFSGVNSIRTAAKGGRSIKVGGLELVDLNTCRPLYQIPVGLRSDSGGSLTQNPFYVKSTGEGLRFYFIPEDNDSKMYIYDVKTN